MGPWRGTVKSDRVLKFTTQKQSIEHGSALTDSDKSKIRIIGTGGQGLSADFVMPSLIGLGPA